MEQALEKRLQVFAAEIRLATFNEFASLGFGHVGGAMSMVDALAVLYGAQMNIDPANPTKADRDYFVLSKGHSGPALYATLALKGYFPQELLSTLNQNGTTLPSHCSRMHTPGIDMTTGSLGQGASTAAGLAKSALVQGKPNRVYLMLGDGECNEGQVWEAAMFAAHHKLGNLTTFVDANKKQLDGTTAAVCDLGDIGEKFAAFGWHVQTVDGHDVAAIYQAVENGKLETTKPSAIILNTIKGKGCVMCEEVEANHHIFVNDAEKVAQERARMEQTLATLQAQ